MYRSHTILAFNIIFIFKFALKRNLTSFNFFFCVFKTHVVNLIQLVLIIIRFDIFMWSFLRNYFLLFLKEYFINSNVNSIIITLLPGKFLSVFGIVPVVLSMPNFSILRTRVSQVPGPLIHMINVWVYGWDMWVWTYPLGCLHIFSCAFQHSHSCQSKSFTRRLLFSLTCCYQYAWHLP